MKEIKIRINEETKKELLLLTVEEGEKSMSNMIQQLLDFYKERRGNVENVTSEMD